MPKEDTEDTKAQKKKAVDAIISGDGQTNEITIKYDDGSIEKFIEREC